MDKQVLSSSYDTDTGTLTIRLLSGEEYYVTHAGHARRIKDKISPGGMLNTEQVSFLAQYLRPHQEDRRAKTLRVIREIRKELSERVQP